MTSLSYGSNNSDRFEVWLDVWDPTLNQLSHCKNLNAAILTALIIEMGLINSCAVIALITEESSGSGWIPYEFGRVKKSGPFAQEASACLRDPSAPLLEYMALGPKIEYADNKYQGLDDWLARL